VFKRLIAAIVTAAFAFAGMPAFADTPYVSFNGTLSGGSPYLTATQLTGQSSCTVASSGAGTLAIEVSQDATNWTAATIYTPSGSTATSLTLPASGVASVASYKFARAHLLTGAGGTVYLGCGAGVPVIGGQGGGGGSSSVTVTNFPNPQNVNITQIGGHNVTTTIPVSGTVTAYGEVTADQGTAQSIVGAWPFLLTDGTNVAQISTDGQHALRVEGVGVAGTPAAGVSTVQGVAGGTPVPISGTITATTSQPYSGTADGQTATAASVVGLGAFNGTTYDRVRVSAPGTSVTTSGVLPVQGVTGGVPINTSRSDTSTSGTLDTSTLNTTLVDPLGSGQGTTTINFSGTWTGIVTIEGTADGTNWITITLLLPSSGTTTTTVGSNNTWIANSSGWKQLRARTTVAGSGTASIAFNNSTAGGAVQLTEALPNGANTIGTVNTPTSGAADGAATSHQNGVYLFGYNSTNWDRVRLSTVGTSIGAGAGALGFQGITGGVPVGVNGTGTAGTPNAGVVTVQGISGGTSIGVTTTPLTASRSLLTSASATSCTSLEVATTNSAVIGLTNAANVGQTAVLDLYDEGASPTCTAADHIYSIQLGASQIITFANGGLGLTNGLAYTLSVTLTSGNNITIQRR